MRARKIYYYGHEELDAESDVPQEVDVMYCLDFYNFEAEHAQTLGNIYAKLPEYLGLHKKEAIPCWFDNDDDSQQHLMASVETPFGLQISGLLNYKAFEKWDELFRTLVIQSDLPLMYLDRDHDSLT